MNINKNLDIYLVIGLTKEARHWSDDFLQEIKRELNPVEIHLVDLPGSGKLLHKASPLSISKIVDTARSTQTFHLERKRLVVAISLGGMVAWDWVSRYPQDFHGMVMINSSLAGVSPLFKRLQPRGLMDFLRIATTPQGEKKEKLILGLCSNHPERSRKILPRWVELGFEAPMSFRNILHQFLSAAKFRPTKKPQIPLLVIAAKHDRLAHFSCSQDTAKLAQAKLVICEDPSVGHAFHVDAPEFLVKTIKAWWELPAALGN
jgi:pimeloyl-ACP methyl ester carboxylesterase